MPTDDFAPLHLPFVDQTPWRDEVIRPLVLFADRTPRQRAHETATHPATVRALTRRFQRQGMLGLLPEGVEVSVQARTLRVPETVREELDRLKALYDGFGYRELARILFITCGVPMDHKTVKALWQASAVSCQGHLGLWDYHAQPDRYQARLQVIQLYYRGWDKISISRFLHVSRPTINAWIQRFEAEHFAGLVDKSPAPHAPARKVWLPLMVQVYHLQKAHPDAGRFRIWSLLARSDISERTVGRIMALNKLIYHDIPHVPTPRGKPAPGPHPDKASHRQQYWCMDGRRMDVALEGVRWWSLIILEGYSRTMLAGMIAPTEATWVALMVLYTACLRYGAPEPLVSDSGGASTSHDCEAVCRRLQIHHETIESTTGERYQNLMETPFNIQRRLYDYQFSLARTPAELEPRQQAFMHTDNTTAPLGWLQDRRLPPIPAEVLGAATGRRYTPEELARAFAQAMFPRTTTRDGCVTLHRYHFSVEEGLPQTQVLLWLAGTQLRAAFQHVILAEYHCRYDWRDRRVKDVRPGVFHPTHFASPQGTLLPLTPHDSLVVYRTRARRRAPAPSSTLQLLLFEVVPTA